MMQSMQQQPLPFQSNNLQSSNTGFNQWSSWSSMGQNNRGQNGQQQRQGQPGTQQRQQNKGNSKLGRGPLIHGK